MERWPYFERKHRESKGTQRGEILGITKQDLSYHWPDGNGELASYSCHFF